MNLIESLIASQGGTGGYNGFAGPIVFGNTRYALDLTQVANAIASRNAYGYRITGPYKSLNALISEICDVLQFDFCYHVSPSGGFPDSNGGDLINSLSQNEYGVIKVICVDKGSPPSTTAVKDFIAAAKDSGTLISSNNGIEYQNATTQRLVVGGSRTRYQAMPVSNCVFQLSAKAEGGIGRYQTLNGAPTGQTSCSEVVPE